ncbi:MAG: S9 family peptidase [Bacteroidales bacterium]|nr:S9 family peptidase [Bacteroidales bacterium]
MKKNQTAFLLLVSGFLLTYITASSQERIPLSHDVYDNWKNLERPQISNNGKFVAYEINPQQGDGSLIVSIPAETRNDTIERACEASFSPGNGFIVYKVKPFYRETRKAKLDGKKKDELPKDSLGISAFNGKDYRLPGLKSFSLPVKGSDWLAALLETPEPEKTTDTSAKDTSALKKAENQDKKKEIKGKKKDKTETFTLKYLIPGEDSIQSWDSVTSFAVSENGRTLAWATYRNDSLPVSGISLFDTGRNTRTEIFHGPGFIKNIALDTAGIQLAFLYSSDTSDVKRYSLYHYRKKLILAADTADKELPAGFSPGENGKVWFSQDGIKLFFGIAPTPRKEPKDTLTDDEKARVDVWNWKDPLLQPQQLKQLDAEKKRTFMTVFYPENGNLVRLANDSIREITTGFRGNGRYALGYAYEKYMLETSWKDANYRDVYLVDMKTGHYERMLTRHDGPVTLSTTQKYLSWYNRSDSLWYTMDVKHRKAIRHSAGKETAFYDEEHDVPSVPGPVGFAGWTQHDDMFVVYDRFDLWGLDPAGADIQVNLTKGEGRLNNIRFQNTKLNQEVPYIGENGFFLLNAFDETNKDGGFYMLEPGKSSRLTLLEKGPFKYSSPTKARNSDDIFWTKGNFRMFPDLMLSKTDFSKQQKVSEVNPQQSNYLWGNVKLVKWIMPDSKEAEGLLYTPEGFDPGNKYPMLVYFYEKNSDQLHQYYTPKPSRSIISPAYCSSNGYLVFIPDIRYRDGFPGQSAYDAVMSGTEALIAKGFVDNDHMGLQGQSWGGYQTAWLVTRTNLFKAAMAGAPVSNMTSAYGGIRWESGMVRQFQYEEGQSRIGATLWERPDLYIENSPLFKADKIQTPLLIMSNDGDGAVPWYQGIELFTAMRRLGKPVWLLNYNGDEHNLSRRANMKDLDIRMMQFFDHYLKEKPAPEWMLKGIPAMDKGKKSGFATGE